MSSSGLIEPDPKEKVEGSLIPLPVGALQTLRRTPPAVLTATPNPVGLLMALRRRWWLALGLAILGSALAAGGVWFLQKSTFTARTLVHVHSTPPIVLANVGDRADFSNYRSSQIALVKSRLVLNSALLNSKVSNLQVVREQIDPVAWLEREIRVDFSIAPEILRIAMTGDDPKEITAFVEAVRDAYLTDIIYKEKTQRANRIRMLKDRYEKDGKILSDRKKLVNSLAADLGSADSRALAELYKLHVEQKNQTKSELLRIQLDLLRARLESTPPPKKDGVDATIQVPKQLLEEHLVKEPEIANLIALVLFLKNEIKSIEDNEVDPTKNSGYESKKKSVQLNEKKMEVLREKLRPQVETKLLDNNKPERRNPLIGDGNIAALVGMEKLVSAEFVRQTKELKEFKEEKLNVEDMRDGIAQADEFHKKIGSYLIALEIELDAPDRVESLNDTAYVPDTDTRIKKSAMAGAGVFALIIFGIALLEFRQRRVNNVDEVVRGLDMRLMGTLPAIPNRTRRQIGSSAHPKDAYWQNVLTESVDSARTMLLHMAKLESRKVVMVTSAVGGEGKTLLSCHLAISLARAGLRTLLVDCDLRSAAVHKVFGLAAEPGFGNLLSGDTEIAATIQVGPLPNLWVLPAGQSNTAAFQALAQHGSREIFNQLKDQFDFVLVDSAPILPVADSLLIAPCVDAVILSILRDVSRLPSVYAAYERLAALRVHFLGAVVNGTSGDYYRSRYPYQGATAGTPVSVDE